MLSLTLSLLLAADPNMIHPPTPPSVAHDVVVVVEVSGPHRHTLSQLQQQLWSLATALKPAGSLEPLRLGFVFYRSGNAPQVVPLTHDLDVLYPHLRDVTTEGDGGPAPLGLSLEHAVTQAWRTSLARTRDVVVVGGSPVSDLPVMRRALETAAANDVTVHWLNLGTGHSEAMLLAPESAGSLRRTVELAAPTPVPRTAVDKQLHAALLQLADTPVYGGTDEARAAAAATVSAFKALPVTTMLERACYRRLNVSPDLYELKHVHFLSAEPDNLDVTPDAELPKSLRRLTKAQRKARMLATQALESKREEKVEALTVARIDAQRAEPWRGELTRLIVDALKNRLKRDAKANGKNLDW